MNEEARYNSWERSGAFQPKDPQAEAFGMILPPPNITGSLHLGHAYEHTLSDATIRYQRMTGKGTLWIPGLDHAAIATNALLERRLRSEGSSRHALGREGFTLLAEEWKEECQAKITNQMRTLGASPEWGHLTFTLDERSRRATHEAFKRLHDAGLIHRAERLTLWCPGCESTISDSEADGASCSRCHSPLEERSTKQWYLETQEMARLAKEAHLSGQTTIEPEEGSREYLRWAEEIEPWCISRQLWWGHRIPIWYGPGGETLSFGPDEEIPEGWIQDEDTLDTWFSSALWPLTTLGWPKRTPEMGRYYPNDLLITGNDLIFFWALRMMMLCTYLTGIPPFRRILLHGMIRDEHGKKMSKSFGNTIDPLPLMEEHGPDILRLALARRARPGTDIPFGQGDIQWARALARKIESIISYATSRDCTWTTEGTSGRHLERWLLSRAGAALRAAREGYGSGNLATGTEALSYLAEEEISSTYLEARKGELTGGDEEARSTLSRALRALIIGLHPIMPHQSEEWAEALGWNGILDFEEWPTLPRDEEAEGAGTQLLELLQKTRAWRQGSGFPLHEKLPARSEGILLEGELHTLARLTPGNPEPARELESGGGRLWLPAALELTPERRAQLKREHSRIEEVIGRLERRLSDPDFLERSPQEAQERTRNDLARNQEEARRLQGLLG